MSLQQALQFGMKLHEAGRLNEAESIYRQIIAASPNHHIAIWRLGVIAQQRGDFDWAKKLLENSLSKEPNNADAENRLGGLKLMMGETKSAIAHFRKAIEISPKFLNAQYNLGAALFQTRDYAAALKEFNSILKKDPDSANAHLGAGRTLRKLQRHDDADASFRNAVRASDKAMEAGNLSTELHLAKGHALEALGDFENAVAHLRRVTEADQYNVAAWAKWGEIAFNADHYDEAIHCFRKATEINPSNLDYRMRLANALVAVDALVDAKKEFDAGFAIDSEDATLHSNVLYALNYDRDATPETLYRQALNYDRVVSNKIKRPASARRPAADAPLHIGLVSADYKDHPVASFLLSTLEAINPEKFHLIAYCTSSMSDKITEMFQQRVGAWRSAHAMSDDDLTGSIVNDKIDILIDLSGHTEGNRLPVFARKPAPIQITWLGYSGTTGLSEIDYILCDPWEISDEEEEYFTEQPWRLPNTRHCYTPPDQNYDIGPLPAKQNGYVTFGVGQKRVKINADVVKCFAAILRAAPDSRLAFRGKGFESSDDQADVVSKFSQHGVTTERLIFVPRTVHKNLQDMHGNVDIALSPFPWPGITTTCEALWMGVPSVFLKGDRFLGRIGESITRNLDMTDWMGDDIDDYVRIAVEKASDLEALAALRAGLRERFLSSPLCDANLFARNLENAFEEMVRRFQETTVDRSRRPT